MVPGTSLYQGRYNDRVRRVIAATVHVGWRAHAALAASGGAARVLAPLSESTYLTAGDEVIWLGRAGALLHSRAVLLDGVAPALADGDPVAIDVGHRLPWRPPVLARRAGGAGVARAAWGALVPVLTAAVPPDGLGRLLIGLAPPFPLEPAVARALGRACAAGDAAAAGAAAERLLGLGPGLTPSGDDFVGGAFFVRAVLADPAGDDEAWRAAAATLAARARARTHPISAALLGDLCRGEGHAPLHELARGLAAGATPETTLPPARRLAGIGHSSGWDILAGVAAGLGALPEA